MALEGSERRILHALVHECQADAARYVPDSDVVRVTHLPVEEVRDCLETLEGKGFVERSRGSDRFSAFVTAKGRLALRSEEPFQGTSSDVSSSPGAPNIATSLSVTNPPKPAFKGLRSYDQDDAEFFLRLLPGRPSQDGLPPSIRFWKTRIENAGHGRTFGIGLIHGPSGCGKSSMVKAGLIPRLAPHVRCVYVEASPKETEAGLLNNLRSVCPELGEIRRLTKFVEALSQGRGIPDGQKVLIILDQFEQWLHANLAAKKPELISALRHCEGGNVQAIVLVRDDYWTATSRFSESVKSRFVRDHNSQCLYLFEKSHGQYVLTTFGQDCGRLDDPASADQREFIRRAIGMLAIEDKILPVRLALFCLVFQSREWTIQKLEELGSVENIEVEFFRYIFDFVYAEPEYREHREAAQAVLGALLPERGSDIKRPKPWSELLWVSGYADEPDRFEELLVLLDKGLYLITPTVSRKVSDASGGETAATEDRLYQLTHDFLVPALRAWRDKEQEATKLVESIKLAETKNVPKLIADLAGVRTWADPRLRQVIETAEADPKERLNASLALLPADEGQFNYLYGRLLEAGPSELDVIRVALHRFHATLIDPLWQRLAASDAPETTLPAAGALALYDPSSTRWEKLGSKVAEAMVRAKTPDHAFWTEALRPVRTRLAVALASLFGDRNRPDTEHDNAADLLDVYAADQPHVLADLLMNSGEKHFESWFKKLAGTKDAALRRLKMELDRSFPEASEAEKDYNAERQARATIALIRWGHADEVWPRLQHSPDPRLRSFMVNWLAPLGVSPSEIASVLDLLPTAAKPTPTQGERFMDAVLYHRETSMRRALIIALGTYDADRLPSDERGTLKTKLLDLYRNDPDSGIHGAVAWTLRKWGEEDRLKSIDAELSKLKDLGERHWYVNGQGQTFAVIEGPVEFLMGSPSTEQDWEPDETLRRMTIPRRFAIADRAVTVEQYQHFVRSHPEFGLDPEHLDRYCPEETGPMIAVSWYGAAAYCNWLSEQESLPDDQWCYLPNSSGAYDDGMAIPADVLKRSGYRLPTEAEWEYACRSGTITSRYYGHTTDLLGEYAWYQSNSRNQAHPGGSLIPNDLGLFDMLGNVYEWVQDQYGQSQSDEINILESVIEKLPRLLRGGSFSFRPAFVRSAFRGRDAPADRNVNVGFRPSRTYY